MVLEFAELLEKGETEKLAVRDKKARAVNESAKRMARRDGFNVCRHEE
jgi:hypothetical protein